MKKNKELKRARQRNHDLKLIQNNKNLSELSM